MVTSLFEYCIKDNAGEEKHINPDLTETVYTRSTPSILVPILDFFHGNIWIKNTKDYF